MSEAAPRRPSRGSSGGCRRCAGFTRRAFGGSIDGRRSGLTTTRCWRIARGWVLGSPRAGTLRRAVSGGRQGASAARPSGSCDAEQARTGRPPRRNAEGPPLEGGRSERVVAGRRDAQSRHHLGSSRRQRCDGVGAERSATSACKRTRHGAAGKATIGSAQAPRSGVGRSVGTRDNWSAAEIAKGHLASASQSLRALENRRC